MLTVSIDGPKEIHNRYRRFKNGKPTFNLIINNLKKMRDKYPEYYKTIGFSCAIHPPYNIEQVFNFFENDLLKYKSFVNYSLVEPNDTYFYKQFSKQEIEKYDEEFEKHYEALLKKIANGMEVNELLTNGIFNMLKTQLSRINKRQSGNLPNNIYPNGICKPLIRKTFINENGDIYICEKINDHIKLGNIYNGIDFDTINRLLEKYKEMCEMCKSCWLARICGQCIVSSETNNKLSISRKREMCTSSKSLYEKVFKLYLTIFERKEFFNELFTHMEYR